MEVGPGSLRSPGAAAAARLANLLVEEAGGDVGDPEDGGESDDCGDEEGLKSALAMDATGEEEVEPDEAGVLGLGDEAEGEEEDAEWDEAVLEEAPDSDNAEADDEACEVAFEDEEFAV